MTARGGDVSSHHPSEAVVNPAFYGSAGSASSSLAANKTVGACKRRPESVWDGYYSSRLADGCMCARVRSACSDCALVFGLPSFMLPVNILGYVFFYIYHRQAMFSLSGLHRMACIAVVQLNSVPLPQRGIDCFFAL